MPHAGAGRTSNSSGTVTVPVIATRPRSLRTRSTIMMFSATSLTDARSAAGSSCRGSVPLIGLDVTASPRRRGTAPATATPPHPSRRPVRRPRRGRALHRFDEEVDRCAVEAARELRAHAGLVDLTRRDRLQALEHPAAVRVAVGLAPRDPAPTRRHGRTARSRSPSPKGAPERLSYHHCPSLSWRSTQSDQPPAASGIRGPPVDAIVGIRQITEPSAADRPARRTRGMANTSLTSTAVTATDGAMTAPEPNHSPINAAGGGKPCRRAWRPRAAPQGRRQIAEPLDPHQLSVAES